MSASREQAIKNLKGMTGAKANPNGRPKKGYSITESFREMFDASPEKKNELVASIFKYAKRGDATAIKLIWNYMDGTPVNNVDVKSGGKPVPMLGGQSVAISTNNSNKKTS